MRKLFLVLVVLMQCFFMAIGNAEEQYPEENYYMYYQGYKQYPITFVQWGEGYVLDGYSIDQQGDNPNILVADVHPVNMDTNKMSPKTLHIRVEYTPHTSFKTCLTSERGLEDPITPIMTYTGKKIGASTAETGMLFFAGRMLWELKYHEPFFANEPALKRIGEAGCPLFINVAEGVSYSRVAPNRACISKNQIFYEILFTPTYFIIENYHTSDGEPIAKLESIKGSMQAYETNADVALVKEYMGVPKP